MFGETVIKSSVSFCFENVMAQNQFEIDRPVSITSFLVILTSFLLQIAAVLRTNSSLFL